MTTARRNSGELSSDGQGYNCRSHLSNKGERKIIESIKEVSNPHKSKRSSMDDTFCDVVSILSSKLHKIDNILRILNIKCLNQNIVLNKFNYFSGRVETQAK